MLEVITGPMYSGKTEEMIRLLRRAQIAGKKVVAFKPAIDNRYDVDRISSHNGTTFESIPVHESGMEILNLSKGAEVIGIDEAQFFGYKLQEVVQVLLNRRKHVILSGLNMTYRAEPWAGFPYFLALAERIYKLDAVCVRCGTDANFTQRLIDGKPAPFEGPTVLVGALESYEARCRECFEKG